MNNILEIGTNQTGILKQVFKTASQIFSDCCLEFTEKSRIDSGIITHTQNNDNMQNNDHLNVNFETPKIKTAGLTICRLSEDKSILFYLKLNALNFDSYICKESITCGIDIYNLSRSLQCIDDNNPLIFYIQNDKRHTLFIKSIREDGEEIIIEHKLLELSNIQIPLSKTRFNNKITIPFKKFCDVCRQMQQCSGYVEISSHNAQLLFVSRNEGYCTSRTLEDNTHSREKMTDVKTSATYDIRNLLSIKYFNKDVNIDVYLKNDFPLVLTLPVSNLGKMYIFLSPIEK